jgi:hypothetical protein
MKPLMKRQNRRIFKILFGAFGFFFVLTCAASVHDNEILYLGGSVGPVPGGTKGRFDILDKNSIIFNSTNSSLSIPYRQITRLGYGEKVSRRILEAIVISPWFIFSKRHQHFVTIQFSSDSGTNKAAVFEIGKDNCFSVVAVLENRTGLKFEFDSRQAEADFRKRDFRPGMLAPNGGGS